MAAETDAPPRQRSSRRENVFTRHIGPLPMWAWLAIVAAVILGYAYWKNRQSSASSTSTTANASQVPQFVNQTYTTVQPPTVPPIMGNVDSDNDDTTKKKPKPRKHPTHDKDAAQDKRQEARQDVRQANRATRNKAGLLRGVGVQRVPKKKAA